MGQSRRDLAAPAERIPHGPWWLRTPQRVSHRRLSRSHGCEPGVCSRCSWHDVRRRCRRAGCGRRPRCRRASAVRGSGGLTRWAREGRREGQSSGGGCSSTPTPRRGVVAANRRVALPPARATRWASRSSGTVGLPHARIDHPPVTLPSPVLVVTLTVCGSSAPENVAAVRVPPYPLRLPGRFFVTSVGRSDSRDRTE